MAVLMLGEFHEAMDGGRGGGQGLVDDDVLAGLEGAAGEGFVGVVRGGDDEEVKGRVGEGCLGGAEEACLGVLGVGGVAGPLYDGGEFEAWDGADKGAVKDAAGEAVAEDGDADGGHGRSGARRWACGI